MQRRPAIHMRRYNEVVKRGNQSSVQSPCFSLRLVEGRLHLTLFIHIIPSSNGIYKYIPNRCFYTIFNLSTYNNSCFSSLCERNHSTTATPVFLDAAV